MSRNSSYSTFPSKLFRYQQFQLTSCYSFPIFFIIGIVLIFFGVLQFLLQPASGMIVVDYTDCVDFRTSRKCVDMIAEARKLKKLSSLDCTCKLSVPNNLRDLKRPAVYYWLEGFYQNYRSFYSSYSDSQLRGKLNVSLQYDCSGLYSLNHKKIYPCGYLANSIFNDSIKFVFQDTSFGLTLPYFDQNVRFKNAEPFNPHTFQDYAKPPNWNGKIYDVYPSEGVRNFQFMNWMTPYPFKNTLKLLGIWPFDYLNLSSVRQYTLTIQYNYDVSSFKGRKKILFMELGKFGSRNIVFFVVYVAVGFVSVFISLMSFLHYRLFDYGSLTELESHLSTHL